MSKYKEINSYLLNLGENAFSNYEEMNENDKYQKIKDVVYSFTGENLNFEDANIEKYLCALFNILKSTKEREEVYLILCMFLDVTYDKSYDLCFIEELCLLLISFLKCDNLLVIKISGRLILNLMDQHVSDILIQNDILTILYDIIINRDISILWKMLDEFAKIYQEKDYFEQYYPYIIKIPNSHSVRFFYYLLNNTRFINFVIQNQSIQCLIAFIKESGDYKFVPYAIACINQILEFEQNQIKFIDNELVDILVKYLDYCSLDSLYIFCMFIENIIDDNWEIIYKSNFIQKIIILSYKCSFKLKKKLSYIFSILITKAISYEVNDENWIYSGFELIIDTLSFFSNKKIHLILSNILESFDNYSLSLIKIANDLEFPFLLDELIQSDDKNISQLSLLIKSNYFFYFYIYVLFTLI